MSHEDDDSHIERVWQLAEEIGIAMFITWDGHKQRARPLAAHIERDAHAIYFLTDVSGHSDDQAEAFPTVTLAFADTSGHKYVAITGEAEVSDNRDKIRELFTPFAKAWWDSPDDPSIRLITVRPDDAELWDSPGKLVSGIKMLAAAITGRPPNLGDNAKLKL